MVRACAHEHVCAHALATLVPRAAQRQMENPAVLLLTMFLPCTSQGAVMGFIMGPLKHALRACCAGVRAL